MKRFNDGDVVSRKAGGPLMTVEDIDAANLSVADSHFTNVVWFDSEGKLHRDSFASVTLQRWQIVED